jgi:hypothetical protein
MAFYPLCSRCKTNHHPSLRCLIENILPPAPGSITPTAGYKADKDKLRYDLIPPYALERLVEVYTLGAKKYSDDNYLQGMSYRRVFGALLRHAFAWLAGRSKDPEDGQHPLASVAWCAFALMEYEHRGIGVDDRKVGLNPDGFLQPAPAPDTSPPDHRDLEAQDEADRIG